MIEGYLLTARDNDQYMLRGDAPHPACGSCGMASDRSWIDPSFTMVRTRLDASYTYDGYMIVSEQFRSIAGTASGRYLDLPSSPGFFVLTADHEVEFDAARRGTSFDRPCTACGRHFAVAGATPVLLVRSGSLPDIVSRTDVEFGTGDEQHPLLLVGPGLARRLREAHLIGFELLAIAV
jgi:hypothetical protein